MKEINTVVENRFDDEVKRWNENHNKEIETIIEWEIFKRKEITKNYLKKNYSGEKISILEIGCGTGNNLHEIIILDKNWKGSGVDISSGMIKHCIKKYSKDKRLNFDVLNIDYEILKKKYDVIIMLGVVGYLESNHKAFQNVKKMLKDDGALIFTYGNKISLSRLIRNMFMYGIKNRFFNQFVNFIRIRFIGRKEKTYYSEEKNYFKLFTLNEIKKSLPENIKIIKVYNIVFSSGIMGKYSLKLSKFLERFFIKKDLILSSFTKIAISKNKK